MAIFWDISKWNRGQKKWDEGSKFLNKHVNELTPSIVRACSHALYYRAERDWKKWLLLWNNY